MTLQTKKRPVLKTRAQDVCGQTVTHKGRTFTCTRPYNHEESSDDEGYVDNDRHFDDAGNSWECDVTLGPILSGHVIEHLLALTRVDSPEDILRVLKGGAWLDTLKPKEKRLAERIRRAFVEFAESEET